MALIKCRECKQDVSDTAKKCPHCGIANPKRAQIGTIPGLIIIGVAIWGLSKLFVDGAPSASVGRPASASAAPGKPAKVAEPVPNWTRYEHSDAMTDERFTTATVVSANGANFSFPYQVSGGSKLRLTFRKRGTDLDAMLRIEKGQMLCSSLKCGFSLRVGDGPVQKWTGLQSSTHDSDLMFVRDARDLEAIIKSGQPIRIGIEFYRDSERVFKFDTSGYPGV